MDVATKDPGMAHFYWSLLKSGIRIVGCLAPFGMYFYGIENLIYYTFALAGSLFIAELVGILEEL